MRLIADCAFSLSLCAVSLDTLPSPCIVGDTMNKESKKIAAGKAAHTPFAIGHLDEGGTGVTNFDPKEGPLYREAICRYGDSRLAVLEADFMDHSYTGLWSLHQIGGGAWEVLPDFWPVFDALRAEVKAIQENPLPLISSCRSDKARIEELEKALKRTLSYIESQEFASGLKSDAAEEARTALKK